MCYNQNATPPFELNRKHLKQMWQPEFWIKELLCVSTLYKFALLNAEPTCFVLTLCIVQGTRPIQWNNLLIKENNIARVLLLVEWSKLVTVCQRSLTTLSTWPATELLGGNQYYWKPVRHIKLHKYNKTFCKIKTKKQSLHPKSVSVCIYLQPHQAIPLIPWNIITYHIATGPPQREQTTQSHKTYLS